MPRSVSGTYTLPLPPVVPNTTIEAAWANTTDDDIAQALTDSLDRYGRGGMVAPFRLVDGSESIPAWAFSAETGTGMWRDGDGVMAVSVQGAKTWSWTATAAIAEPGIAVQIANGTAALPSLSFNSDTDTGIFTDAVNSLRFVTGGVSKGTFKADPGFHIGDYAADTTSTQAGLYNRPRLSTSGTTQYGTFENTMFGPTATVAAYGLFVNSRFADGAYDTNVWSGLRVGAPALGVGHTIGTARGVMIDDLTGDDGVVGILSQVSAGTNKWFLYGVGTALSFLGGALTVQEVAYGGSGANTSRDTLVLEGGGISILTPNNAQSGIAFGDPESNVAGQFRYSHVTDTFDFVTAGVSRLSLNATAMVSAVPFSAPNVRSGTYTPVAVNVANMASITPNANTTWMQVGDVVTVAGTLSCDPTTAATASGFRMTLPVASAFASSTQAGGGGTFNEAGPRAPVAIFARPADDQIEFSFLPSGAASATMTFTFSYTVV